MRSTTDLISRLVDIRDHKTGNGFDLDSEEVKMIADEFERLHRELQSYERLGGDADRYSAICREENPLIQKDRDDG